MAINLAREGHDRKACTALLSTDLCPDTPETVQALRGLHPAHPQPIARPAHDLPLAPEMVPDAVAKALRSFPADTAPGPSGLRVQHLREATAAGEADALFQHLASVVGLLAQGQAYPAAAAAFAGARLIALPKPKGGVRPITIGETLRRLTAKCLMAHVREMARDHFWSAQVGVAVPSGVEAAMHITRSWVERHAQQVDHVLLKLDFKNAFNEVSRQNVLDNVQAHFPALARWTTWCYQHPSSLYFGRRILIPSAAGVQQGDPLGPLLFAAAIQPLAEQLQATMPFSVFYLDDGVVAGDALSVSQGLQAIQQVARSVGLTLNLDKCELVAVGPTSSATLTANFPAQLLADVHGNSRVLRDFDLLGAAIGTPDFVAGHTLQRVQAGKQLLDTIASLEDPQVGLRLLRACAGHCRLVHSLRCNPPAAQRPALLQFDAHVRACFSSFTGLHLDPSQWGQASRGFGHAGLGLRATAADAAAAYLAFVGGCGVACSDLDAAYPAATLQSVSHVVQTLAAFNEQVAGGVPVTAGAVLGQKQKALATLVDSAAWARQLATTSAVGKALLHSEQHPGARAFLAAVPHGVCRMEPAVFLAELRLRLGVAEASLDTWCPRCDSVLDTYSLHAGVYAAGRERTRRHHAVREVVLRWADRAGLQPERETPEVLLPQRPEDSRLAARRPANIFLPFFGGSPTALDIAITAPQRRESLLEAGKQGGAAAAAYARVKAQHLQTATACEEQGVRFQPMVFESTGAFDISTGQVLQQLARAVAARAGGNTSVLHDQLLQELCSTIRTFRARAALRRRVELSENTGVAAATVVLHAPADES